MVTSHLVSRSSHRVGASPLLGGLNGRGLVILPALGNIVGERVVGIGSTEEGLDRKEDGADLERGGPVVYIDVSAQIYPIPVRVSYSSGHPSRSGPAGRCWGGRSW